MTKNYCDHIYLNIGLDGFFVVTLVGVLTATGVEVMFVHQEEVRNNNIEKW